MHYPDLEFTLSLLVSGRYTRQASGLLRSVPHPLPLSLMHRLQVENGLLRKLHGAKASDVAFARNGLLLWHQYLLEQIFAIRPFDMEAAIAQAVEWNVAYELQPPKWSLLIHPALALVSRAVFMSFNPMLRRCARDAGLALLPGEL